MTSVFSKCDSIYCIIRKQYFNKIGSEKLPELPVNQERT